MAEARAAAEAGFPAAARPEPGPRPLLLAPPPPAAFPRSEAVAAAGERELRGPPPASPRRPTAEQPAASTRSAAERNEVSTRPAAARPEPGPGRELTLDSPPPAPRARRRSAPRRTGGSGSESLRRDRHQNCISGGNRHSGTSLSSGTPVQENMRCTLIIIRKTALNCKRIIDFFFKKRQILPDFVKKTFEPAIFFELLLIFLKLHV